MNEYELEQSNNPKKGFGTPDDNAACRDQLQIQLPTRLFSRLPFVSCQRGFYKNLLAR